MKKLNIILLVVLILLVAFVAYFFIGGTLQAQPQAATAPAADHPEAFASIQNILSSGAAPRQFAESPASAEGCTLADVTITLSNYGLFDAEWIDVSVIPAAGDVAVYSLTGEASSLPARSTGQINLKLITTAAPGVQRTVQIHYYIFGMLRSISLTI